MSRRRYYGKYRGTVVNATDPQQIGRVQVSVGDLGITGWAMPCLPLAAPGAGLVAIPPVGAMLWVEFERGDIDYPIWVGGFWQNAAELPASPPSPSTCVVLQTPLGHRVTIDDMPGPQGGVTIRAASGASISVTDIGIQISNGQGASISLTGPLVSINNGALEVS